MPSPIPLISQLLSQLFIRIARCKWIWIPKIIKTSPSYLNQIWFLVLHFTSIILLRLRSPYSPLFVTQSLCYRKFMPKVHPQFLCSFSWSLLYCCKYFYFFISFQYHVVVSRLLPPPHESFAPTQDVLPPLLFNNKFFAISFESWETSNVDKIKKKQRKKNNGTKGNQ